MTKTVVDYCILSAEKPELLTTKVKKHIEEGWQPSGNMSIVAIKLGSGLGTTSTFYQPVVLEKDNGWPE